MCWSSGRSCQGPNFQATLFWPRKELLLQSWFWFKRQQSPERAVEPGLGHAAPSGPQGSVLSKHPWEKVLPGSHGAGAVAPPRRAPPCNPETDPPEQRERRPWTWGSSSGLRASLLTCVCIPVATMPASAGRLRSSREHSRARLSALSSGFMALFLYLQIFFYSPSVDF